MVITVQDIKLKPGYKQTEVGVIPEDWEVKNLSRIADLTSSKRIFEHEYVSSGIPFYRGKEVSQLIDCEQISDKYFISESRYNQIKSEFGVPKRGDILITAVGTLGNVYVVPDESRFYFKDGNLIWLRGLKNTDSYYVAAQIRKNRQEIVNNAIGSSQKALTIVVLKNVMISLPPLPEQQAIATALSDVDALITSLDRLIAKKRNIKQAMMQQLLTGKTRLPGFSGELKAGYKQTEVGILPENWEVKKLKDLCISITDGTHYTPRYVNDGIPFYSVENITANNFTDTKFISLKEHNELIRRCKPVRGDILLTRIGSLGYTKLINWEVNASIYVSLALLKMNSQQILADYIYEYSKSDQFVKDVEKRSLMNATPIKINMGQIGNIPIPCPPLPEQKAIATIFSDMDAEIAALEQKRDKTHALKQGMMQELLTGKTRLL
jgi:type I restriction enzyme, S subunit